MAKYKLVAEDGSELELNAENLPKEVKDQIIQGAQALVYQNIDTKIQEMFQANKNAGEKTSDFVARLIQEREAKIVELKEKSPDVSKFQEDIQKLQTLNDQLKTQLTQKESEFSQKLNSEFLRSQVAGLQVSIPAHLTEKEEIEAFKADAQNMLLSKFEQKYYVQTDEQGNRRVFDKATKEPVSDENLRPLSVPQIFQKENPYLFKEVKAPQQPTGGGGGGKPSPAAGNYKSFEDIAAAAVKAGHAIGSPAFTDFISKEAETSGVEI